LEKDICQKRKKRFGYTKVKKKWSKREGPSTSKSKRRKIHRTKAEVLKRLGIKRKEKEKQRRISGGGEKTTPKADLKNKKKIEQKPAGHART